MIIFLVQRMPNSGRCVPVYLCAGLYIANGGGDHKCAFVIHIRDPRNADYERVRESVRGVIGGIQINLICAGGVAIALLPG